MPVWNAYLFGSNLETAAENCPGWVWVSIAAKTLILIERNVSEIDMSIGLECVTIF